MSPTVVGGVLLAADEKLRVEELAVGARTDLINRLLSLSTNVPLLRV